MRGAEFVGDCRAAFVFRVFVSAQCGSYIHPMFPTFLDLMKMGTGLRGGINTQGLHLGVGDNVEILERRARVCLRFRFSGLGRGSRQGCMGRRVARHDVLGANYLGDGGGRAREVTQHNYVIILACHIALKVEHHQCPRRAVYLFV